MNYVIINALLYISLLIIYWNKRKTVDSGFLLIAVWAIVAICGLFLYLDDPNFWTLTPLPFIYLFVAFLLFARMYIFSASKWDIALGDFVYKKNKVFDVLCILFILCTIFNTLNSDFSVSSISMENIERTAADNYDAHIDRLGQKGYSNIIERFTLNFCSWFKVAALIGMYNFLCQRRNKLGLALGVCIFFPTFLNSIMMGTRSTIFTEIMLFLSAYLLYKKYIPKETKKRIFFIASFVGVFLLLFVIAVTNSRFSDSEMGSGGSVLWYFGQSMLYFDNGLADSVDGSFLGARTFKTLYPLFGLKMPISLYADMYLGTSFGTNFTTFIGMLILDFGFIGTLAIGLLLPWLIEKMCFYKKSFTFASLYLYLFFLNRLIFGVFTNVSGADFQYIIAFLFYFIFRFIFDTHNGNLQLQSKKNILWN